MKRVYIVYMYINKLNGNKYIGKTYIGSNRFWSHENCKGESNKLFYRAIKKHGIENFSRLILKEFDSENEAYEYERDMIALFNTFLGKGYNADCGGIGGVGLLGRLSEKELEGHPISRGHMRRRCTDFGIDFYSFHEDWYGETKGKNKYFIYTRIKDGESRRFHDSYRTVNVKRFETIPTTRKKMRLYCERNGLDFYEFHEVLSTEMYEKNKTYFYKKIENNEKRIFEENEVYILDNENISLKPIVRRRMKLFCKNNKLSFLDFHEDWNGEFYGKDRVFTYTKIEENEERRIPMELPKREILTDLDLSTTKRSRSNMKEHCTSFEKNFLDYHEDWDGASKQGSSKLFTYTLIKDGETRRCVKNEVSPITDEKLRIEPRTRTEMKMYCKRCGKDIEKYHEDYIGEKYLSSKLFVCTKVGKGEVRRFVKPEVESNPITEERMAIKPMRREEFKRWCKSNGRLESSFEEVFSGDIYTKPNGRRLKLYTYITKNY